MPVQIGAPIESDFTDPVGMLKDCHRRIERFLGVLRAVGEQARGGPLNEEQRQGLETALRYFREGAPRHVEDEEASLFPRLRQMRNAEVSAAMATVERLEADHASARAWHEELDELGRRWLRGNALDAGSIRRFRRLAQRLSELYAEHIHVEDDELFPLAESGLAAADLKSVGREMAERRGAQAPGALAKA